ncbi:MAG: hypothetical protein ACTSQ8_18810 [Candidatus Helarchaeota archaeon]
MKTRKWKIITGTRGSGRTNTLFNSMNENKKTAFIGTTKDKKRLFSDDEIKKKNVDFFSHREFLLGKLRGADFDEIMVDDFDNINDIKKGIEMLVNLDRPFTLVMTLDGLKRIENFISKEHDEIGIETYKIN